VGRGVKTLFIEPGSPWENGYSGSFNGKLRDRIIERGDLLLVEGGADTERKMEAGVQHDPAPQLTRIPATSA
jgi:hypothetical protein